MAYDTHIRHRDTLRLESTKKWVGTWRPNTRLPIIGQGQTGNMWVHIARSAWSGTVRHTHGDETLKRDRLYQGLRAYLMWAYIGDDTDG